MKLAPAPETTRSIMKTHVLAFSPHTDIEEAVRELQRHRYAGAPVVDDQGAVVGMLSEQDLLRVLSNAAFHGAPSGTVEAYMTRGVQTVAPDADLFALAGHFMEGKHRRLPVVENGRLVGLVTRRDLLDALERAVLRRHHPTTYELIAARRES